MTVERGGDGFVMQESETNEFLNNSNIFNFIFEKQYSQSTIAHDVYINQKTRKCEQYRIANHLLCSSDCLEQLRY